MRLSTIIGVIFICVIVSTAAFSQPKTDRYQQIQITLHEEQKVQDIAALGFDLEGAWSKEENRLNLVVREDKLPLLESRGIDYVVLVENVEAFYANRLREAAKSTPSVTPPEGFGYGSMGGYYTYDEMVARLDSLHMLHPEIVSERDSIGVGYDGHIIWAVKISDNPGRDESEPEVLYTALHHAREPAGMMSVMYYMWWLAENYGTNEDATWLVDERELWFIPCINPDGYVLNQERYPDGGGMWRKNMRDNDGDGLHSGSADGVDLNRNYGAFWGYDDIGSSPDESDQTYRGASAFSEPETQAIRTFVNAHHIKATLNYHAYGDLMIHPFAYAESTYPIPEDHKAFIEYAREMTNQNGYHWGTGSETVDYVSNGDSDDWLYDSDAHNTIFAMTPEVGGATDGFWPVPARLYPLAEETLLQNKYLAFIAGAYPRIIELHLTSSNPYSEPGDQVQVVIAVENAGLGVTSPGEFLDLLSPDENIVLDQNRFALGDLPARALDTLRTTGQIAENIPAGASVEMLVTYGDGGSSRTDTLHTRIGAPLFMDNGENGMANWTSTSWGISASSYSQSQYFTDSPDGRYQSNQDQEMTLKEPFDLSEVVDAELRFRLRCLIEPDYDFGQVLASKDSVHWKPLSGVYTRIGSGYGVQQSGEPGYDGDRGWLQERMNLDEFTGEDSVYLRFQTIADRTVSDDGMMIDDIAVYGASLYDTPFAVVDTTPVDIELPYRSWGEGEFTISNVGNDSLRYSIEEHGNPNPVAGSIGIPRNDLRARIADILRKPANLAMIGDMIPPEPPFNSETEEPENQIVITDSIGDYVGGQSGFVNPDIETVSVNYVSTLLYTKNTVTVQFREPVTDTIAGIISLDTDQNHGTGQYPAALGILPPSVSIGSEYEILALPFGLSLGDSLPNVPAGAGLIIDMADSSVINPIQAPVLASFSSGDRSRLVITFFPNVSVLHMDGERFNIAASFISGSLTDSVLTGFPDIAPDAGHGAWGGEQGASWLGVGSPHGTVPPNESVTIPLPIVASISPGRYSAQVAVTTNGSDQQTFNIPVHLNVLPQRFPTSGVSQTIIQDTAVVGFPHMTTVELSNTGEASLGFLAADTSGEHWIKITPFVGTIQPGETSALHISYQLEGYPADTTLHSEITLISNDPNQSPMTIPVNLQIGFGSVAEIGDMDHNGMIDNADLQALTRLVLKLTSVTPYTFWAGDLNRDGVLDIRDIVLLNFQQ